MCWLMADLAEFDRLHLWHPYTSVVEPLPAYPVASARGVRLKLDDGRELIDGMASWWCAIHGYNHAALNAAATDQLARMAHVMFGGLTHAPAVGLAEDLLNIAPNGLEHVFLADSGSVAVEVALKMAIQYWVGQGRPEKHRMLALRGGYHGDTLGAMSVCDPVTGMHRKFARVLPEQLFAPRPASRFGEPLRDDEAAALESLFEQHHAELAAVILEPIVQGAGGMWFYSADYLARIADLCREYNVLLIADEIATAFGRAGRLFACDYAQVTPDILCVGKALTGGYMTLAATLATRRVAEGVSADGGVLMHGPTFMGNPLACAVARASLALLASMDWSQQVRRIEAQLKDDLAQYAGHSLVADVRVLGAIGVVELVGQVDVAAVQARFVEAGVWIRPFGRLVYLMPPYVIKSEDLRRLTGAIELALEPAVVTG